MRRSEKQADGENSAVDHKDAAADARLDDPAFAPLNAIRTTVTDTRPTSNGTLQSTRGAIHGCADGPSSGYVSKVASTAGEAVTTRSNAAMTASTRLRVLSSARHASDSWCAEGTYG